MIELLKRDRRLTAIIAVIVLLLIVNIALYMQWQSAEDDEAELEKQEVLAILNLTTARDQHERDQAEADKLRADLDGLRAEEASLLSKPEFPSEFPVVDLSIFLADGAPKRSVTIDKVQPPTKTGTENIGGTKYPAYETKLTVTGTHGSITSFLDYIEGGPFTSVKIKDVNLEVPEEGGDWKGVFAVVFIGQS